MSRTYFPEHMPGFNEISKYTKNNVTSQIQLSVAQTCEHLASH